MHTAAIAALLALALFGGLAEASPTDQPVDEPVAVIAGTPASLRLGPTWFELVPQDFLCAEFSVRAENSPVSGALLTSTGLGDATFSTITGQRAPSCDVETASEQAVLRLDNVDQAGQRVRLRVPRAAFPDSLGVVDGRLRVYVAQQPPSDTPLRLENPYPSFLGILLTASAWIPGVALPALLTLYLTRRLWLWQKSWEKNDSDRAKFQAFVNGHWNELDVFFTTHLANMYKEYGPDEQPFADQLYEYLRVHDWLEPIPQNRRDELRVALSDHSVPNIVRLIESLFPTWRHQIDAAGLPRSTLPQRVSHG
jgi:hypothetical protein